MLDRLDIPLIEQDWYTHQPSLQEMNAAVAAADEKVAAAHESRLGQLTATFGLSPAESDLIQAALVLTLDPQLSRVYAYLHDHVGRPYVTETLVARLFGHGYTLQLGSEAPLKRWALAIERPSGPGEPPWYELDPFVRNWLLGLNELDDALVGRARLHTARPPLESWPMVDTVHRIAGALKSPQALQLRVAVAGPPGVGRRSFAAAIAAELGLPLLAVDTDAIPDAEWNAVFLRAQRQAFVQRCALAWSGAAAQEHSWPADLACFPIQFVALDVDEYPEPSAAFLDYRVELPPLTFAERRTLWQTLVPAAATWSDSDLDRLAGNLQVTVGQIAAAATYPLSTAQEAADLTSARHRRQLGQLAQYLPAPFSWEDLVLPAWLRRALEELAFEAKERDRFWEQPAAQRLFPTGRGLLALFSGAPGTGKTMAAQVIAAALGRELYRVDLSAIVSKYVGETSKNIERILARARRLDVILLFDEADALFGKRTEIRDAHDRFANTDTNYLLQAIEQFPGVAILTSNQKANIDTGFTRRLRHVLEFPKPDAAHRRELWQRLLQELTGADRVAALGPDLIRLAELTETTGAQIKNAVLSALFLARRDETDVEAKHLLAGLERELVKEGRGLGKQTLEHWTKKRVENK